MSSESITKTREIAAIAKDLTEIAAVVLGSGSVAYTWIKHKALLIEALHHIIHGRATTMDQNVLRAAAQEEQAVDSIARRFVRHLRRGGRNSEATRLGEALPQHRPIQLSPEVSPMNSAPGLPLQPLDNVGHESSRREDKSSRRKAESSRHGRTKNNRRDRDDRYRSSTFMEEGGNSEGSGGFN